ncbi:MAG: KipI family sensor histidine kinase inhibitor [Lentisphaeria bacterium]|jgi:KipI family sensor histidine kinase inhibitor
MAFLFHINGISENTVLITFTSADHHQGTFLTSTSLPTTPELAATIVSIQAHLQRRLSHLIVDCVPSYTSLMIVYDCLTIDSSDFLEAAKVAIQEAMAIPLQQLTPAHTFEIPVLYDEEYGPDLALLASEKGLSIGEFITRHSALIYTVCTLGFTPGFAYLGFVDEVLATPRKATPRKKVAAGSVGIADRQTGVYPSDSPGGWNIIGRSPMPMLALDKHGNYNCPLSVGDAVKFTPINRQAFISLTQHVLTLNFNDDN